MSKITYIYARDRKKNMKTILLKLKSFIILFIFLRDGNDMNVIEYEKIIISINFYILR